MNFAGVIVVFGAIAAFFPEPMEANALGRRVGSSVVRGGRWPSSTFGRRGRNGLNQEKPQDGSPQFLLPLNGPMNGGGDDSNGDGIPDWCNWKTPMGAWLNYRNMKLWCARNGYSAKFGPYGGVPEQNGNQGGFPGNGNGFASSDLSSVGVTNGNSHSNDNNGHGSNGLPATGWASNGGTTAQYQNGGNKNGWASNGNGWGAEKQPVNGNGLGTPNGPGNGLGSKYQLGTGNGWGAAKQPLNGNGWGTNHQTGNGNNGNGWGTKYRPGNGNGQGSQHRPGNGNGLGAGRQPEKESNVNGWGGTTKYQPGNGSNGNAWGSSKYQPGNGSNGNAWGSTKYQPGNGKGPNSQGTTWDSHRPTAHYNQLHNGQQGQGSGRYGTQQKAAIGSNGFNQGHGKFGSDDYYNF